MEKHKLINPTGSLWFTAKSTSIYSAIASLITNQGFCMFLIIIFVLI